MSASIPSVNEKEWSKYDGSEKTSHRSQDLNPKHNDGGGGGGDDGVIAEHESDSRYRPRHHA